MGLDAQVKRWWWGVVGSMVGLTALLQAAGAGRMVAATLVGTGGAVSKPTLPAAKSTGGTTKDHNGQPILARNIFDSQTGPLDGSAPPPAVSIAPTAEPVAELTLQALSEDAPNCDFGRVVLISASSDPTWSFAAIEDSGGKAQLRRAGQEMNGHVLRAMSYNRVWFEQAGKQCQLKMGDKSRGTAPAKPAAGPGAPKEPAPATPGNGGISAELASKIHKVSDTEFNVERSVIDEILENQAELMKSARIVPDKQGDKVMGIRLFGIRSGTLLSTLGLKNADRLESINGFDMSDPQKALEAYGRLRTADALKVKVNRGGAPLSIDFKIQ
ncbi:MAG: general secretion pathway protein GspC [Deltaproteobacteria bacterium]|nr:general secretion pathway protein GspC [Deltaproteobacteria bacterium]